MNDFKIEELIYRTKPSNERFYILPYFYTHVL